MTSTDQAAEQPSDQPMDRLEFIVGGMTCASCAARIQKKLNRLPGVQASVNYATGIALVSGSPSPDVIATIERIGYTAQLREQARTTDEIAPLRRRLVVTMALVLPLVVLGMAPALRFDGWRWLALALATPVVGWGAWPFHRSALLQARHRSTSMDTLVSIGITVSYLWSWWAVLSNRRELYLEVAGVVTVLILLGRFLEARARHSSGQALRGLLDLGAKQVSLLLQDGSESRVPIEQLTPGMDFVVRPGDRIATDGVIVDGASSVDTSTITGESVPAEVEPGDLIVGATLNLSGRLIVRATRVGAGTQLAQITRLVNQAQNQKAAAQRLADKVSAIFVPVVLVLAALTLLGWLATGHSVDAAFTAAVAVLIIACPCALGLATPTALLVGTGRGAQLGILIRGPQVLESAAAIDTIVLDKTGTVTSGRLQLQGCLAAPGVSEHELLQLAAAVEHNSAHPIARAIVAAYDGQLPPVDGFADTGGLGVSGEVDGRLVAVGRLSWVLQRCGATAAPGLHDYATQAESLGHTPIWVGLDGLLAGVLVVADTVRPSSASAVERLHRLGLRSVLLTGDNAAAARAVADEVGIAEVIAEVLPTEKADHIRQLRAAGRHPAMVGDGVNDAAALASAELGLSMGGGSDIAIEASDLTLIRPDLLLAVDAIRLSRATLRTIKGNLFWAFGYNVAAIPLAALGFLNPMIAGAAMAFSSVFVVSNSLRLRRFTGTAR
jgi:Cu+-exporting ATPase